MIKLSEISSLPPDGAKKSKIERKTRKYEKRIGELNEILLAEKNHSLLVILQGMDSSGKDGAIRNVFQDCTPFNLSVSAFKTPTKAELAHDFLWRIHEQAPMKGEIKIFNRSHYEDILIQRVHHWIDEERVEKRMKAINAFEELLAFDNGTVILKFYLHISYEQQGIELQQRIDEPKKHWKHNESDWKERELWDEYMQCYEYALNNSAIPWTIVPVDKRWYRDYIISKKVCEALEKMNLSYPV